MSDSVNLLKLHIDFSWGRAIQTVDNCKHALNIVKFKCKQTWQIQHAIAANLIGRIMPTPNRILKWTTRKCAQRYHWI